MNFRNKPDWPNYFIGLAVIVSSRSPDIHTKHGCVITDSNNRILGVGYNGFPRLLKDSCLPTSRPDKYDWMIHAEMNALSNCSIRPENGVAYVTGQCCTNCIMSLYQSGIKNIYMRNSHGTHLFDQKQQEIFSKFVEMSGINIYYVDANLSWLKECIKDV